MVFRSNNKRFFEHKKYYVKYTKKLKNNLRKSGQSKGKTPKMAFDGQKGSIFGPLLY